MVYQAIDLIKFNANVKNLEIIVDIKSDVPCDIVVDDIRIKQILINLLSNAVKFTHEGQIELIISKSKSLSILLSATSTAMFSISAINLSTRNEQLFISRK